MKKLNIILSIFLFSSMMMAQSNSEVINANNIRTMMHSTGQMFWDFNNAQFLVPFDGGNSPAAIFAGGLWMGGLDPVGNLSQASVTYENGTQSIYTPGLADATVNLNRVWKVTSQEINAFIADAADGTIDDPIPTDILEWPAAGNEGLDNIESARLAAFVDTDNDGLYNPQVGDHPAVIINGESVIADELLFTIFQPRDQAGVPALDIHSSMYAFRGEGDDVLSNSLFLQQKVISRELEDLNAFRFSYFIDADLGCHTDDYVGSDVGRNAFFTYNADDVDGDNGNCAGGITTYDDPPVLSLTLLNRPMTHFSYYNNGGINNPEPSTTDPNTPFEEYNLMGSIWLDETPLSSGGDGYDPGATETVKHAFSGDPNNPAEWSMIGEDLPLNDPRALITNQTSTLSPGEILLFDAVINFTDCPGFLTDINKAKENIDELQDLYDSGFERITATEDQFIPTSEVNLYPNPSTGKLFLESEHQFDSYQITDLRGATLTTGTEQGLQEIDVNLDNGLYLIELRSDNGYIYKGKIIIQR